jgi:hypothetical protein
MSPPGLHRAPPCATQFSRLGLGLQVRRQKKNLRFRFVASGPGSGTAGSRNFRVAVVVEDLGPFAYKDSGLGEVGGYWLNWFTCGFFGCCCWMSPKLSSLEDSS